MKEMNIQEKLNLISSLEECGFHEQVIKDWVYDEEHPEEITRYEGNSAAEILEKMWTDVEKESEVLTENKECDSEGIPVMFRKDWKGLR